MSTETIDANLARVLNTVGGSGVPRRAASGGVYPSNVSTPLIVTPVFPLGVGTSVTAISVHLRGTGTQGVTITLKLHDFAADTNTVLGTPTAAAAAGAIAVTMSAQAVSATQALQIEIVGLDANLRFTGAVITYT